MKTHMLQGILKELYIVEDVIGNSINEINSINVPEIINNVDDIISMVKIASSKGTIYSDSLSRGRTVSTTDMMQNLTKAKFYFNESEEFFI